jgi:hypothetical protein
MIPSPPNMNSELIDLLRRRETVIADHAWRDRDPDAHLDALKQVSDKISAWAVTNHERSDARLRHYLANASFAKALAHLTDPAAAGSH